MIVNYDCYLLWILLQFLYFLFLKDVFVRKKNNIAVDYEYLFIVFFSSSDIIECMGNSDNVVRAGLTPKLKDVDTLLDILEFQPQSPEETKLVPTMTDDDPWVSIYNPPVDDFSVKKIQVNKTKLSFEIYIVYTPVSYTHLTLPTILRV